MVDARTVEELGWPQVLAELSRRCHTSLGCAEAEALTPLPSIAEAGERLAEVAEARRARELGEPLPFAGISDVGALVDRAAKGSPLEADELLAVADMARGITRLRNHALSRPDDWPRLAERARDRLEDLSHIGDPIRDCFDDSGELVDHASDELGGLRRQVSRLVRRLEARAGELLEVVRASGDLQDNFWTQRDDRYVLPVRVEAKARIKGIIHGASHSGQTVFIEPEELVDLNNQLKLAEVAVHEEVRRILRRLTDFVVEDVDTLRRCLAEATALDVVAAAARLGDDLGASSPELTDGGKIELSALRHPLLALSGRPCVASDVELARGSTMVISGPNAGGKTVTLKAVGLALLMARSGIPIAAESGSRLPWLSDLRCAIGDSQSLEDELSTFSAHLVHLREFTGSATPASLILIDELCGATEPEQGAALARAVVEVLIERGATCMVTTHYEALKAMAASRSEVVNASVGFDLDRLQATYRLHIGVPGGSYAVELARRLGLSVAVLERAAEHVGQERRAVDELLGQVEIERQRLVDERGELARQRGELARAREEAERALERAVQRERRAHEQAHSEAVSALREARRELDHVRLGIKRRRGESELADAVRRVDAAGRAITEHRPELVDLPGREVRAGDVAPGATVYVVSLGGRGQVTALRGSDRVEVQVGNLKTTVAVTDVRLLQAPPGTPGARRSAGARATAARPGRSRPFEIAEADDQGRATLRTDDITVDVRGQRADDALAEVDRFIDQSLLAERELIFVIHGHGTGALRRAVRELLSEHRAVSKWRSGEPGEGGDGVTVAWLDS